ATSSWTRRNRTRSTASGWPRRARRRAPAISAVPCGCRARSSPTRVPTRSRQSVSSLRAAFATFVACGLVVAPLIAGAPPVGDRSARIGWLALRPPQSPTTGPVHGAFVQAMRDLGYVEGRTPVTEYRHPARKTARSPARPSERPAMKAAVTTPASGTLSALAAKRATSTIPIVFNAVGDPVADGLVTSLARPEGN